jgi:hypothetical protein
MNLKPRFARKFLSLRVLFFVTLCAMVVFAVFSETEIMRAQQSSGPRTTVRHGFTINGRIEGSVQQLTGENTTINGGGVLTGDLLVPGVPTVRLNGNPTFGGTVQGSGSAQPTNYQVTVNGNAQLGHLITRTDPIAMPTVAAPPSAAGARDVTLNNSTQSPGNFATLRDLILNGNVGLIPVPPGTYRKFTANGGSGFVLGVTGSTQPAVYNFNSLLLNGGSQLQIVGPVVLTSATAVTLNATMGSASNPLWLSLQVATGGLTLNGGSALYGLVTAPSGSVTINGNSSLIGNLICDRLTVNGNGLLRVLQQGDTTPPVVTIQQPAEGSFTSATQTTVSGTFSDASQTTITVNGITATIQGNSFTASVPVAEGQNSLLVAVTDAAGNRTEVTRHVVRDTTLPTIVIQQPTANSVTNGSQATVSGTVNDATATTVKVNAVNATLAGNTFSATVPIVEGVNGLSVVAVDAAGNQGAASRNITRDTTAPTIAISQPGEGVITRNTALTVTGTYIDATATAITVNGIAAAVSGSNFTAVVSLSEGVNTLTVQATDTANNQSEVSTSVTRDTMLPKVTLIQPFEGQVSQTIAVLGVVEDATPVTVTANGTPLTVENGSFVGQITRPDGAYSVRIVATDGAGNTAEVSHAVTVDTAPPALSELSPVENTIVESPAVTIQGRVVDATQTSVLVNDKVAGVGADGRFAAEGVQLRDGDNQIIILARDAAGNSSRSNLILKGKDFTPPPAVAIFPVNSPTRLVSQVVEGRAEAGSLVTVTGGSAPVTVRTAFGTGLFAATVDLIQGTNLLTAIATSVDGIGSTPTQVSIVSDPSSAVPPVGEPAQINIATGDTQKGLADMELPRPLIAIVTDREGNGTPGVPVSFTLLQGDGAFPDGNAATVVALSDSQGYARARYIAGSKPGIQLIRANFPGNLLTPVSFSAEVLQTYDGVETTVTGIVLDQNLRALPNVLARLGGQQARTGRDGRFAIENPPTGPHQLLELIGRDQITLPGRWPNISFDIDVLPGVVNSLGRPLFLPRVNDGIPMPLDAGNVITQDITFELSIKAGEAPVRVTARAGTHVTFPPDVTDKRLSVTRIPNDRVPMALEDGRATNLYVSVQPSGAIFDAPLELSFPNLDGEPANAEVLLMSFDHDAGRYVRVGTGHVSADGRSVTSDHGSGIRVGAWHAFPPPPPKPEVTVLGYIQIKGNPAFENKALADDYVFMHGARAVKTTGPGDFDRYDYRLTTALESGAGKGMLTALVYPVEAEIKAEVIDHDVPTREEYAPLEKKLPAFAGSENSTSDFLKVKLEFRDLANVPVRKITWSVKGPGASNYHPPTPSPTATTWDVGRLKSPAGKLTFFAVITFVNGSTFPTNREIDVGIRTDDIIALGWINPAAIDLPVGAQSELIRIMPANGAVTHRSECNGSIFDLSQNLSTPSFLTLSATDRIYILNWMFKYGANPDPNDVIAGQNFRDDSDRFIDNQKIANYLARETNYKLFNRLQVKFQIDKSGFKNTKILNYSPGAIGTTHNPCGTVLGQLSLFPGQRGPNNQAMRNNKTEVSIINEGSPDAGAIRAFNTLMGKDLPASQTPLFWENIGSAISFKLDHESINALIYVQNYPTYYIYVNGKLLPEKRVQAPEPSAHFYTNPYPFGTVPCSRLGGGTTPGGRCGDAESQPDASARVPDIIRQP